MSGDERLAEIVEALRDVGIDCLVMGGHAVRFYGVDRSTVDFDICVSLDDRAWAELPERLSHSPRLGSALEAPSWRPASFRRFVIGTRPDGRDERRMYRAHAIAADRADKERERST